jgi:hypothetical protein
MLGSKQSVNIRKVGHMTLAPHQESGLILRVGSQEKPHDDFYFVSTSTWTLSILSYTTNSRR